MTTGKSKSDFPGGFIPFDNPVGPVPTVAIDASPTVQLCINEDWTPFVITALKALARPESWDDTYENAVIAASEFAALIAGMSDGCGTIVPSILCVGGSFKDLDYGFEVSPGSQCSAVWTAGTGWQMCCNSTPQGFLQIRRNFDTSTLIRGIKLTFETTVPYLINYDITLLHGSTFTSIASATAVTGPTINIDVSGLSEPAEALYIHVQESIAGCAADTVLTDFQICYTGAFPLSVTPDRYTHVFDFAVNDGGWTAQHASYSGGAWNSVLFLPGGGAQYRSIDIYHSGLAARVLSIVVEFTMSIGEHTYNSGDLDAIYDHHGSTYTQLFSVDYRTPPVSPMRFDGDRVILGDIFVELEAGIAIGHDPGGSASITKITIVGLGIDPF